MLSIGNALTASRLFHKLYTREIGDAAAQYGLKTTEADILLFLHNNPQYDTARDIVNVRGIAKSYASTSIELLTQKGYLSIQPDSKDRRITRLHLTSDSSRVLDKLVAAQSRVLSLLVKDIPEERRQEVHLAFQQMEKNIKEALSS